MSENSRIIVTKNAEFYIGKSAVTIIVGSAWYKACFLIECSKTKKKKKKEIVLNKSNNQGGNFVVRK